MFVARDVCELPVMAALNRETGARYYLAVEISLSLPWFLVNTVIDDEGQRYPQSLCCAWERDVADLCLPNGKRRVASIQQMVPVDPTTGGWRTRQITKVWRAKRSDGSEEVVLEDDEGNEFSGAFAAPPADDLADRQLLFFNEPLHKKRKRAKKRDRAITPQPQLPILDRTVDPCAKVSAAQLGELLGGISAEEVVALESNGELFSTQINGARLYSRYQVWPTVPRTATRDILKALWTYDDSVDPELFFLSLNQDLDNLGPVEVLLGALLRKREVREDVPLLLASAVEDRVKLVVAAAEAYAAALWAA